MQPATFLTEHLSTPSISTPLLVQSSSHSNDLGSNDSGRRRASLAAIHKQTPSPSYRGELLVVPVDKHRSSSSGGGSSGVHAHHNYNNVSPRILVSDTNNHPMSPTEETQMQHQGDAAVKEDLITGRPSYNSQESLTGSSFSNTCNDVKDNDNNNDRKLMPLRSFTSLLSADSEHPLTTSDYLPPLSNGGHQNSRLLQAMRRAKKQRRGSVGEGMARQRQKMLSPSIVEPRLTKSSTHKLTLTPRRTSTRQPVVNQVEKQGEDDDNVPWDPHIDAFEILRAKITGITRTMQEFHVHELFQDELSERGRDLKRERHHTVAYGGAGWLNAQRRLSTAGSAENFDDARSSVGHRRIRSHGSLFLDLSKSPPRSHHHGQRRLLGQGEKEEEEEEETTAINSPPPPPPAPAADASSSRGNAEATDPWSHLKTDEDFEQEIRPTSPNLTSLFLTTNSLINSRLDELSETASIASSCDLEDASAAEWRTQFLDLVSACITQSEELESLSTEMLGTERRVRELMVLNESVDEELKEREKIYEERIRECEDVAKQQMLMIDTLTDLMRDLEMKLEHLNRKSKQESSSNKAEEQVESVEEQGNDRWDFRKAVADILNVDTKDDLVQKMRWEVGMFVGGGVGTGHVIHSFEGRLGGIEMIIAGTGTTETESTALTSSSNNSSLDNNRKSKHSTYLSPSLRHGKFLHHHYVLHILPKDRTTKFVMIPRAHWVPDQLVDQCQFESKSRCPRRFSFFERRHHCRRCGKVVCQRHSSNKLPLFSAPNSPGEWSRVCDECFCSLISVS